MQKALKRHILNNKPLKRHILNKKPLNRHRPENCEISVSYAYTGEKWDQNNIIFSFQVASIRNDEDLKPRNVEEC